MICMKVAKAGYYGGNPAFVLQAPVTDVLDVLDYENYVYEYQVKFDHMNLK